MCRLSAGRTPCLEADVDWLGLYGRIARSCGVCVTMGTAATMTAVADAINLAVPADSSILAADAGLIRMSAACGMRTGDMASKELTPAKAVYGR